MAEEKWKKSSNSSEKVIGKDFIYNRNKELNKEFSQIPRR